MTSSNRKHGLFMVLLKTESDRAACRLEAEHKIR